MSAGTFPNSFSLCNDLELQFYINFAKQIIGNLKFTLKIYFQLTLLFLLYLINYDIIKIYFQQKYYVISSKKSSELA